MRTRSATLLLPLLFMSLLGATTAPRAAEATATKTAACAPQTLACRHAKGLLWKIERGGTKPSYLFGTIHISDPRVTTLPPPVRDALDAAQSFTMEVVMDAADMTEMAQTMFFSDGRTLKGLIGPQRFDAVRQALLKRGVPVTPELDRYQPWFLVVLLSLPPPGDFLDLQLQARAAQQNKPARGLETTREQMAVFSELAPADQITLLDETLAQQDSLDQNIEDMTQAYLARDLGRLQTIIQSQALRDKRLDELMNERLLHRRNTRMLERMQPRLREGNAFIAVGAAHLPGERGLLALLEQAGWRVTSVY